MKFQLKTTGILIFSAVMVFAVANAAYFIKQSSLNSDLETTSQAQVTEQNGLEALLEPQVSGVITSQPTTEANPQAKSNTTATNRQNTESSPAPKIGTPNWLWIPSLKIASPVTFPTEVSEDAFQKALKDGAAHYPGTPLAGQLGNIYIFGHSSDYSWSDGKFKRIFAPLPGIKVGAEIRLSDASGNIFRYKVVKTVIALPNDVKYLQQDMTKKVLTVQTSYPVGTAKKRFLAISELIEE
jgi:LPXTG-site transpeptidase (sortase) family protein